jgi:uncharacterized protein YndB with AHSA1/START domain
MPNKLHIALTGDADLTFTRRFDAAPALLWRAMTEPALITQWLFARDAPMTVCEQDFRVGGTLRWVWRAPGGHDMGVSGRYLEITPPHRLIHTELFDEDWTGGETTVTYDFTEIAPQITEMRLHVRYPSAEIRKRVAASPMAEGMDEGYTRLDGLIPTFRQAEQTSDFQMRTDGPDKIIVTRSFNAPVAALRNAHTDADMMLRWIGPTAFPVIKADVDARTGGGFRIHWQMPDGSPLTVTATYLDLSPSRIVHTELFDPDWTAGPAHVVTDFIAHGPRTLIRMTITYSGTPARDSVFTGGMRDGLTACFEQLEALVTP